VDQLLALSAELASHGHPDAARRLAHELLTWHDALPPAARQALGCPTCRAEVLMQLGRDGDAQRLLAALAAADSADAGALRHLGVAAARAGDRAAAERAAARIARLTGRDSAVFLYDRAAVAANLGDPTGAIRLLQQSLARGLSFMGDRFHPDPALAPLVGRPDYEAITRPRR
jgi:predicted Zn-dependent protease